MVCASGIMILGYRLNTWFIQSHKVNRHALWRWFMKHVWDKGNSIVCIDEDHMVRKAPWSVLFTVEWSWCCFDHSEQKLVSTGIGSNTVWRPMR